MTGKIDYEGTLIKSPFYVIGHFRNGFTIGLQVFFICAHKDPARIKGRIILFDLCGKLICLILVQTGVTILSVSVVSYKYDLFSPRPKGLLIGVVVNDLIHNICRFFLRGNRQPAYTGIKGVVLRRRLWPGS